MTNHISNALWALQMHLGFSEIALGDRIRLWWKTIHLYLAFQAFTDPERPARQLRLAMISALLSAIYDYETDWVKVQYPERSLSFALMDRYVESEEARTIGKVLFLRDWENTLSAHGLERGSDALHFYWLVIRSRWMLLYSREAIEMYGRKLQIVDDILDYEKDKARGDKNCFLAEHPERFIQEAHAFLGSDFFLKLAGNSWVYRVIRKKCERKLAEMEVTLCGAS